MTPAEKMGLKVGDKVRVTGTSRHSFLIGEEIVFKYDDDTSCPVFSDGFADQWVPLSEIEPITKTTTVTGPATITVAAGETITFDGNATVKQDWVPKFGDRVVFVDPPEDVSSGFGVIVRVDSDDQTYCVAYGSGGYWDADWRKLSEIKPYEAA